MEVAAPATPTAPTIKPSDKALTKKVFLMFFIKNHPFLFKPLITRCFNQYHPLTYELVLTTLFFLLTTPVFHPVIR
ncbi:hypothetical protein UF75_4467 [Desulfosporosinus sp. I2]|nr:hypothetical protein UF75_4467 [Desulfosporosinus sp. I2]